MELSALLTSASINIGICVVFLSLYSILRKQPSNVTVYFGRRLAHEYGRLQGSFSLDRFVPSPGWILKAWGPTEEEILAIAGLDAVVFLRILVFSIRIFSIAAVVCIFGVLPMNYFGQETQHNIIASETLDVFTIDNVIEGSQWIWVHCVVLYIITCAACTLLYFEYKKIYRMRLSHVTTSHPNPSHFSILVRAIPTSKAEPLDATIENFFSTYHGSSYLSHQRIYREGTVRKIMYNAEKVYKRFLRFKVNAFGQKCRPNMYRCCFCGGISNSFHLYQNDFEIESKSKELHVADSSNNDKASSAAFVFFKTRYAAVVASQILQSSNPMTWVTDLAPDPHDVYWSNLWIPYRQLWFRRVAVHMASVAFMLVFIAPVAVVQGLTQLDHLQQKFPFLKGILKNDVIVRLVTGYLPSVILMLALYTVPPTMMLFAAAEGCISRSSRKKSACCKVLYFNIWNIFFVNVLSGSVIKRLSVISSARDIPVQLAKAVPGQATFFMTYVLTSGWASLSAELIQIYPLFINFVSKFLLRNKGEPDYVLSFPYHTEIPRVLLLGLLGFTCSILAPLILPFLLIYFLLGYLVYRNQFLNVYCTKYESGGQMWPVVHNAIIFSLVLAQIIALGVFGMKKSPMTVGFTIPLLICTILFNEYCRQRFNPIFRNLSAQDLIEMDRRDLQSGKMEEVHQELLSAYCQHPPDTSSTHLTNDLCLSEMEATTPPECSQELRVI